MAGTSGAPRRPDGRRAVPGIARWIILALALQAALAAIDIVAGDEVVFTTTFVLAPFALAVAGAPRRRPRSARDRDRCSRSPAATGTTTPAAPTTCCGSRSSPPAASLATLAAAAIERAAEQRRADGGARGRRPAVRRRSGRGRGRGPGRGARPGGRGRLLGRPERARRRDCGGCSSTASTRPARSHERPRAAARRQPRALVPLSTAERASAQLGLSTRRPAATTPTISRSSRSSPAASRSCWPTPGSSPTCAPRGRAWTASSTASPRP